MPGSHGSLISTTSRRSRRTRRSRPDNFNLLLMSGDFEFGWWKESIESPFGTAASLPRDDHKVLPYTVWSLRAPSMAWHRPRCPVGQHGALGYPRSLPAAVAPHTYMVTNIGHGACALPAHVRGAHHRSAEVLYLSPRLSFPVLLPVGLRQNREGSEIRVAVRTYLCVTACSGGRDTACRTRGSTTPR